MKYGFSVPTLISCSVFLISCFLGHFAKILLVIKNKKPLTLSIIIPVYNEENYLAACLESIAAQTVKPHEVIVVDNNSTDRSMAIARGFQFVKIIKETRPHQSYAQQTGFNTAKGDILGRIDADTILPSEWVAKITDCFWARPATVAVTGSGMPYDTTASSVVKFIFDRYYHLADTFSGHTMLWGANCAIRKTAWRKIADEVLLRPDIWEDYDLSFCVAKHGKINFLPEADVEVSFRSAHKPLPNQVRYQFRAVRTFAIRKGIFRAALFMSAWSSLLLMFPLLVLDKYVFKLFALDQKRKIGTISNSTK